MYHFVASCQLLLVAERRVMQMDVINYLLGTEQLIESNSQSAGQEISCFLWNQKIRYCGVP
jgi:hypothetical protein